MNKELELTENKIRKVIDELRQYYRSLEFGPVSDEEGRILQILIEISNAKDVLEIGTSLGVSSLWMTLGLLKTKGKLITFEAMPEHAQFARQNFEKAGVQDIITLIERDAVYFSPLLKDKFDFIFMDGLEREYLMFFNLFFPLLKEGGIIVSHDVITKANDAQDYIETLNKDRRVTNCIIRGPEIATGMLITYKNKELTG